MKKSRAFIQNREEQILKMVNTKEHVSVRELSEAFAMSPSTARKQLALLHEKGLLLRTHGGASRLEQKDTQPNKAVDPHSISNYEEKLALCKLARTQVHDGDVIGMCGGTTTYIFSTLLHDVKGLTIVTNSIPIANELMYNPNIEVRVCGGIIRADTGSLIGPHAENFFKNIYLDKAFIGATAVSPNFGATSPDMFVSHLEQLILSRSKNSFILADHSKFTRQTSTVDLVASIDEVSHIITDTYADQSILQELRAQGVEVLEAGA